MSLGARLQELRAKNGKKSLQEVADDIGISKAHLWELEKNKSKNPSADLLMKLAQYYMVSVATLIGEAPFSEADEKVAVMFRLFKDMDLDDQKLIEMIIQQKSKGKKEDGNPN